MSVKSICGVILIANAPDALAKFYREALGLNFQREDHGGLDPHFGVDIGELHFGIHPPANMGKSQVGNSSIAIAFNVESLERTIERLNLTDARQVIAPHDEGFGLVATYRDPEGNCFEIVELNYEFTDS